MTDYITDTYELTVTVIQHGDIVISNVVYPTEVEAGQPFTVTYDVTNNGSQDTCWGHILNTDTNMEIANTRWQDTLIAGGVKHCSSTLSGITADLHGKIEVGYYTE